MDSNNTEIKAVVLSTLMNGPQLLFEREIDENIFDDAQSKRLYRLIYKTFRQGTKCFDENLKINLIKVERLSLIRQRWTTLLQNLIA